MEQNFQGDLTDILRASGSGNNNNNNSYEELLDLAQQANTDWEFTSGEHHQTMNNNNFSSLLEDHGQTVILPPSHDTFGDPFSHMKDPLVISVSNNNNNNIPAPPHLYGGDEAAGFYHQAGQYVKFRPSCNVFTRMLQINPSGGGGGNTKPEAAVGPTAAAHCDSPRGMIGDKPGEGVIDGTMSSAGAGGAAAGGLQISSARNPGAIKRRKSQAKKVVCIPAPAAANSRASGEVVPSDLWAWRKYGQKPIKGSPYPRGYYRCSSSKGCSARKQVERSRTDPNMLVITYTSEHNHPWPTQRNALAGSTRSQPTKVNNTASSKSPQMIGSHQSQPHVPKEEQKSEMIMISNNNNASTTPTTSTSVKEESVDQDNNNNANNSEKRLESLDDSVFSGGAIMSNVNDQDFFAELGEIEVDPLNLLFSQGFSSSTDDHNHHKELVTGNNSNNNTNNKGLLEHPFSLFDWAEGKQQQQ